MSAYNPPTKLINVTEHISDAMGYYLRLIMTKQIQRHDEEDAEADAYRELYE